MSDLSKQVEKLEVQLDAEENKVPKNESTIANISKMSKDNGTKDLNEKLKELYNTVLDHEKERQRTKQRTLETKIDALQREIEGLKRFKNGPVQ